VRTSGYKGLGAQGALRIPPVTMKYILSNIIFMSHASDLTPLSSVYTQQRIRRRRHPTKEKCQMLNAKVRQWRSPRKSHDSDIFARP